MQDIHISQCMLDSLEETIRRNQPPPDPSSPPTFGSIYFGALPSFADGKPHYAMVRAKHDAQPKPAVHLSPITSKKKAGKKVMKLPPGELPRKVMPNGTRRPVASYVLLFMSLRISKTGLERDLDFVKQLNTDLCEQARRIIREGK